MSTKAIALPHGGNTLLSHVDKAFHPGSEIVELGLDFDIQVQEAIMSLLQPVIFRLQPVIFRLQFFLSFFLKFFHVFYFLVLYISSLQLEYIKVSRPATFGQNVADSDAVRSSPKNSPKA